MRHILARSGRADLRHHLAGHIVLAFDFDGTLAPIVADPAAAALRKTTRTLLPAIVARYPCVVISGRARADVRHRLADTGITRVVGNHGLDPSGSMARYRRAVRRWLPDLRRHLEGLPGVVIEDKALSVAVHFRASRNREMARNAILTAVSRLGRVRVIPGKAVVNVLPPTARHKGVALGEEVQRLRCSGALYVGDDDTDEDVFMGPGVGTLLAIRVGRKPGSGASHYLRTQAEVDTLLKVLISLRPLRAGWRGPGSRPLAAGA